MPLPNSRVVKYGSKYFLHDIRIHAETSVAYFELHLASRKMRLRSKRSAMGHGINGIFTMFSTALPHKFLIEENAGNVGLIFLTESDFCFPEFLFEEVQNFMQENVQIVEFKANINWPDGKEKIHNNTIEPIYFFINNIEIFPELRIFIGGENTFHELNVDAYAPERIFNFMGNRSGKIGKARKIFSASESGFAKAFLEISSTCIRLPCTSPFRTRGITFTDRNSVGILQGKFPIGGWFLSADNFPRKIGNVLIVYDIPDNFFAIFLLVRRYKTLSSLVHENDPIILIGDQNTIGDGIEHCFHLII